MLCPWKSLVTEHDDHHIHIYLFEILGLSTMSAVNTNWLAMPHNPSSSPKPKNTSTVPFVPSAPPVPPGSLSDCNDQDSCSNFDDENCDDLNYYAQLETRYRSRM